MEALPSSDVLDSLSESESEQGSVVAMVTESSSPYCETAGIVGGGYPVCGAWSGMLWVGHSPVFCREAVQ